MSYNNPKIINVFYKEDRKPYDENGRAISFFGEDFIGANNSTKVRFRFVPAFDFTGWTALAHIKRADGQLRFEILDTNSDDLGDYFELQINGWFTEKAGKLTIGLKIYDGEVTFGYTDDVPTSIESVANLQIIASDIFTANIGFAPNANEVVPPYDDTILDQIATALGDKPNFGQTIKVVAELPSLVNGDYDNQWFLEKGATGDIGKLWHINGSTAEEVELNVGAIKLKTTGNGEVTANSGKLNFDNANGTASLGLFNNVNLKLGQDLQYYGKASGDIFKGNIVQFAGYQGDHYLIKKAVVSEISENPQLIMGMATQNISNNAFGYVTSFGKITGFDTKGYSSGTFIWFDSNNAQSGNWTGVEPSYPKSKILIGVIIKEETSSSANNGIALIRPTIQPKPEDLYNVKMSQLTDVDTTNLAIYGSNSMLKYNSETTKWEVIDARLQFGKIYYSQEAPPTEDIFNGMLWLNEIE
jgi:hypothetical protein